jgi:LysM repeat protein
MMERAKLPQLGYESEAEAIAEKFHVSVPLLRALNPGQSFAAGTQINVPEVQSPKRADKASVVVIEKSQRVLKALDGQERLIAQFRSASAPAATHSRGEAQDRERGREPQLHLRPSAHSRCEAHYVKADVARGRTTRSATFGSVSARRTTAFTERPTPRR